MLILPPGMMLVRPLATGATFEAALVRHVPARRGAEAPFVLKRPAPGLHGRPEGAQAIEREWEILLAFAHGSLPRPLLRGEDPVGLYLAETLAPGIPLRSLREGDGRGLSAEIFRRLALASSEALANLHEHADKDGPLGFAHGDLSPDNVLFDLPARISFVDFATSVWRGGPVPVFPRARGTLPYAPPEVARGESGPTAAGDTYSLAAILAWLLMGKLTEASSGAALLAEVGERGLRVERLAGCDGIPARALDALRDALAFEPGDRIGSSRELADTLRAAFAA